MTASTKQPQTPESAGSERLAYRLDELSRLLGVSRRTIERVRSAGRFPKPCKILGKRTPLWSVQTIRQWVEEGGG